MFDLNDIKISYILISPEREENTIEENSISCSKLCNILYSKDWTIIPVKGFFDNKYENSFICISPYDNNVLRGEAISLMDQFSQDSVIVKYIGETSATKILKDGSEKKLNTIIYDSNLGNKTYLWNGVSFSFLERKRYYLPKKKDDFKKYMVVEYFNNNKWIPKKISDVDTEWEKMFKILVKYGKVRVEF